MSTVSERSWNSSDDYEDDNTTNQSPVTRRISLDLDIPGGVITTHCVSTVIRPGSKQTHDPLQFVKIQSTELSKKAVEQIRLAEEVKITKEKIKEVEEEWQNNLLNWKSKRRQSRLTGGEESGLGENQQRKVKTFQEILNEKAKSGHRIGYNLHKYIGIQDEEEENLAITNQNNINNNNNNINNNMKQETESSRNSNAKNDLGDYREDDESNQLKSYEQQQAELQKKRQELNNKLQELEQLEKKQCELERQERVNSGSAETVPTTLSSSQVAVSPALVSPLTSAPNLTSPTVIISIKPEESSIKASAVNVSKSNVEMKLKHPHQQSTDCFREKKVFNRDGSSIDSSKRDHSDEAETLGKIDNESSVHHDDENRQKSVWNYLLQQQDDPRAINHRNLSNQKVNCNHHSHSINRSNLSIDSESEDDDHLNDSMDADKDAEKAQMLSFRAKLSTFESLSKIDQQKQQQQQQLQQQQQQQQQQQSVLSSKPIRKSEKVKKTADQITSRLFPSTSSLTSTNLTNSSSASSISSLLTTIPATLNRPGPEYQQQQHQPNLKESEISSIKLNRPPRAEDLTHKEEMKVFQQRLQNQNLFEQPKPLSHGLQLPLQVNSINSEHSLHNNNHINHQQNFLQQQLQPNHSKQPSFDKSSWSSGSPSHLPVIGSSSNLNQLSKAQYPQQPLHHAHHQYLLQQHHHSRTSSEETRESSNSNWETSNLVCDKEVEKISERMNKANLVSPEYVSSGMMVGGHVDDNGGTPTSSSSSTVLYANCGLPVGSTSNSIFLPQTQYHQPTPHLIHSRSIQQQPQPSSRIHSSNNQIDSMSANYHPIHHQRAINQSLIRYHHYQGSINPPIQHPQRMQPLSNLPGLSHQQKLQQKQALTTTNASTANIPASTMASTNPSSSTLTGAASTAAITNEPPTQALKSDQLYSNYYGAQSMDKSQSTPNMSYQLTSTLSPSSSQPVAATAGPNQQQSYNINHWVIQEAELRRLHYTQSHQNHVHSTTTAPTTTTTINVNNNSNNYQQFPPDQGPALMARSINRFPQTSLGNLNTNTYENHVYENSPFPGSNPSGLNRVQNVSAGDETGLVKKNNGFHGIQNSIQQPQQLQQQQQQQQTPSQQQSPSHGPLQLAQPIQQPSQKQMLSVSGKKKCSNCGDELGRGCAAMVIETLSLYYHINCFRCSVCHIQLGNGTCGTDVRVRNHKLHCQNCYSNDEAGLKFSRV